MNQLYPLKFSPIFKDKIWGGQKIKTHLGMDFSPYPNCGEVWVISGVKGNTSIVSEGFLAGNKLNELIEVYMDDLVGGKNFEKFGTDFPVLIKFLDANDWLSIQVHPDDELAKKRNLGYGKTEMWYILQAEKGSQLISGFNREADQKIYLDFLSNKKIKDIMNFVDVEEGDVVFMPAGRVHALGPGILLAEIQQTSDTTYRIYDWDRVDDKGKSRELHTEEALEAIDYKVYENYKTPYAKNVNETNALVQCPYFTANLILLDQAVEKDFTSLDSFVAYICTDGAGRIEYENGKIMIQKGDAILVPAMYDMIRLFPDPQLKLLEVYLPE